MRHDPVHLWASALRQLRRHVSDMNYQTWLVGTEGVRIDGATLVVGTRSAFVTEWLRQRLRPLILRVLADLADEPLAVEFEPLHQANGSTLPELPGTVAPSGNGSRALAWPRSRLHPRYALDTFVVGPGNQLAYEACAAIAVSPGATNNPLFLYGAVGLGKTHLIQGIGHRLVRAGLDAAYVSAEQFTNDLVSAIRNGTQPAFREHYRALDALIIDDVQFISGKLAIQEELFHTFNSLHESGRQIVLASDTSPPLIPDIGERLRSRFEWGLIADILAPDFDTRVAILRSKAREQSVSTRDDVLHIIAQHFTNNVRELEGSLTRVAAYARLSGAEIDVPLAEAALAPLRRTGNDTPPAPSAILDAICRYFSLERDSLLSRSREQRVTYPRHLAMYLMRELTHRSLSDIGRVLGGRDHSTVHHGWSKTERSLTVDPEIRRDVAVLTEIVERSGRAA